MNSSLATKMLAFSLVLGVLFVGLGYAQESQIATQINQQYLQQALSGAAQYAGCKANFTVTVLNDVISDVPSTSANLSAQVTAVNQANSQLQSLASSDNPSGFQSYLRGTFDPAITVAGTTLLSSVKAAKPNATAIAAIRSQYNASKVTYQSCALTALKNYGDAKVSAYKQVLAAATSLTQNISAKVGVNTATLSQDIQNANTTAVVPLQNAINSATNATQLKSAINGYCLFDGCPNGVNAHLDAHYTIDLFYVGLAKLQQYPNATSAQNITTLQGYLTNASSALGAAGTGQYTTQQNQTIWTNMEDAAMLAKQILNNFKLRV